MGRRTGGALREAQDKQAPLLHEGSGDVRRVKGLPQARAEACKGQPADSNSH